MTKTTYRIDTDSLTVIATDANGEAHDLNVDGMPCQDEYDLRDFINDLRDNGAFGELTRGELLEQLTIAEKWDRPHD